MEPARRKYANVSAQLCDDVCGESFQWTYQIRRAVLIFCLHLHRTFLCQRDYKVLLFLNIVIVGLAGSYIFHQVFIMRAGHWSWLIHEDVNFIPIQLTPARNFHTEVVWLSAADKAIITP